jgi:hypothetical protein
MPDPFRADLDRHRFIVLAVAFGANLPLMAGSPQHHDAATFDAAIEIEDSRWIESLLRHMTPVPAI